MKVFVLFVFIPSLIVADNLCPNGKTTCTEDKQCCEVGGEYSCCDLDDDQATLAKRLRVFPGAEIKSSAKFENTSLSSKEIKLYSGNCDALSCSGTCCSNSSNGCCEYSFATCCSNNACCPSSNKCCGDGCCDFGYNCCKSWCCKEGYRCGKTFMTCRNKAVIISFEIAVLITLASSALVFYRL